MENIIILLIAAAVMVGGAVSSALKKKREREAEASGEEKPERKFVSKSLSEVLEELANKQRQGQEQKRTEPEQGHWVHEQEAAEAQDDYYGREMSMRKMEVHEMPVYKEPAYKEGGRVTRDLIEKYTLPDRSVAEKVAEPMQMPGIDQEAVNPMKEALGGEFDLRRAVIESEILKPKFEQY